MFSLVFVDNKNWPPYANLIFPISARTMNTEWLRNLVTLFSILCEFTLELEFSLPLCVKKVFQIKVHVK